MYDIQKLPNPPGSAGYKFALLPVTLNNTAAIPPGTLAWTTDQNLCVWNGAVWSPVGGSVSGSPSWAIAIAAIFATTVNDANPAGWSSAIARIQATPASGGSTLNGLVATGFSDGQSILFVNESSTDVFTFSSLSSACATVTDRFNCPALGVGLSANSSVQITRDNGYWTFS